MCVEIMNVASHLHVHD